MFSGTGKSLAACANHRQKTYLVLLYFEVKACCDLAFNNHLQLSTTGRLVGADCPFAINAALDGYQLALADLAAPLVFQAQAFGHLI